MVWSRLFWADTGLISEGHRDDDVVSPAVAPATFAHKATGRPGLAIGFTVFECSRG